MKGSPCGIFVIRRTAAFLKNRGNSSAIHLVFLECSSRAVRLHAVPTNISV